MYRLCSLFLLMISLTLAALAQTSPAPELQIIRFGWSKYQPGSLGMETGVAKAGDRNSPDTSQIDAKLDVLRDNKEAKAELEKQRQEQLQKERSKVHLEKNTPRSAGYKYSLETKNASSKEVTEVLWDYVFTDPRTQQEVLRYHFASKVKIKPGKSAKLTIYSVAAPYLVVDAKSARGQTYEQVVIKRIVYSDSSVWEAR